MSGICKIKLSDQQEENPTILWTWQRTERIQALATTGKIVPDFSSTRFPTEEQQKAYAYILNLYNSQFKEKAKGLIFGIIGNSNTPVLKTKNNYYQCVKQAGSPGGVVFDDNEHKLLKILVPAKAPILVIDFYRYTDLIFAYSDPSCLPLEPTKQDLLKPNGPGGQYELMVGHISKICAEWVREVTF